MSYGQRPKVQKPNPRMIDSIRREQGVRTNDTLSNRRDRNRSGQAKQEKAEITQYLIINHYRDTTFVDTTLSLKKDYKFNYLRKDNFELLPFSNLGQTYNKLSENFAHENTLPLFAARARHFNYMELEDTYYYHVPTPLTELFYKTAFQQGQLLDAMFTTNISKHFNFSIGYKGLRSLGVYQHILTSTGNFRFTANYYNKTNRYRARAHFLSQDLMNQENGGLLDEDLEKFESGNSDFLDRGTFDPRFQNAESILIGKRFYLEHEYDLFRESDSLKDYALTIGNKIHFEDKYYQYKQDVASGYLGGSFGNVIHDKVTLEDFRFGGFLSFRSKILGNINFNVDYLNLNYGYNSLVNLEGNFIRNRIKESLIQIGGAYKKEFSFLKFRGNFSLNLSEPLSGNHLRLEADIPLFKTETFTAFFANNSAQPNFNQLLFQSDYINYNWDNYGDFENVTSQTIGGGWKSEKYLNLFVDYSLINNYTYFGVEDNIVQPLQNDGTVSFLKFKVNKEFRLGHFGLDNTIMYQNILDGTTVFNVPEFISRNTFYYENHLFDKALYLQTGITFKYFTKYNMNAYDPVLAEFYVQNDQELGGFPMFDFFVNAKVRQTRLFFKLEHFNSSFTGYNYYSAPNYPYRDFVIRFGLVWNFFL